MTQKKRNNLLKILFFAAFVVFIEVLFFRNILTNDNLIGSNGDARYIDLILEHYYRFLQGQEKFTDLRCFYPVTNTISYSDMLLALAIPFCILRALGVSMFMANKIGLILIHLTGTASTVALLDKKMKLKPYATVIGTIVFCYASSLSTKTWHNQMLAVCLFPLMFLLLWSFFENIQQNGKKRILCGLGAISILALVFYTSFYNAYYFLLYAVFTVIAYMIVLCLRKAHPFKAIGGFIRKHIGETILYVIYGCAIMFPFIKIYLPTLRQSGGWDWETVILVLPTWRDYFNVGPFNIVYGAFMQGPYFKLSGYYAGELRTGFPLVTMLLFIAAVVFLRINAPKKLDKRAKASDFTEVFYWAAALGVLCCFASIFKFHGHSIWKFFFYYVPGASGLRAIARFNMFLTLPVGILTAVFIDRAVPKIKMRRRSRAILLTALSLWLIVENTLSVGARSLWNIHDAVKITNAAAAPPDECKIMFITDSSEEPSLYDDKDYQLTAWEIAYKYDIWCINGHSGQFPPEWAHMSPVHGEEAYSEAMGKWIEKYGLKDVWSYDIAENTWTKYN